MLHVDIELLWNIQNRHFKGFRPKEHIRNLIFDGLLQIVQFRLFREKDKPSSGAWKSENLATKEIQKKKDKRNNL